jgi:hypothetical protein
VSDARALLATVANPFAASRVDNAWESPPVDVSAIHREAYDGCLRLIDTVARDHHSHGAVLTGQPGSGKTHVLARLRRHIVEQERGWFVYVLPVTAPDRFFRHVLHAFASDVMRPPHGTVAVSQLEVALARHFMADSRAPATRVGEWWDRVRAHHGPPAAVAGFLRRQVEPLVEALNLDEQVVTVVAQFAAHLNRPVARAWLLGRSLSEGQCAVLGVGSHLDDEGPAEMAIQTLLRLGGDGFPATLAFDQIEGLQRDREDQEGLRAFANGVAALFGNARNVAALTCAQVSFLEDLRRAVGVALYDGRLKEYGELSLQPLDPAQIAELASRRLAASTDLQQVRLVEQRRHGAGLDPLWPLRTAEVEVLAVQSPTPREVLRLCRELLDTAARAAPAAGAPAARAPEPLEALWLAAVQQQRDTPVDKIDEGVYVDGLLKAVDAAARPGLASHRSKIKDIDLVLSANDRSIGVSVCHAENMTSLAGRLRRLSGDPARENVDHLCVVRDARLPIPSTARKTREYLQALEGQGAVVVRPPAEAYVALAAIRNLLAESAAGDLTIEGRIVPPVQLKEWLARNFPAPVGDLIDEIAGPAAGGGAAPTDALVDALRRLKVAELDVVAAAAGLSVETASEAALGAPTLIGVLSGPPVVVFLQPDAAERT